MDTYYISERIYQQELALSLDCNHPVDEMRDASPIIGPIVAKMVTPIYSQTS